MVINMVGGGGGSSLNVISAASVSALPAAAEGTIGVITTTAITSWVADYSAPSPVNGMVYIALDKYSNVPINVAKGNNIARIYPTGCQQYVSGVWTSRDMRIRHSNAWVTPYTYIYLTGNQYTSLTGGWSSTGSGSVTFPTGYMLMTQSGSGASVTTVNKVDLTRFTKIVASFTNLTTSYALIFGIRAGSARTGDQQGDAATVTSEPASSPTTLDISTLSGSYYVSVAIDARHSNYMQVQVPSIYLL